MTFEEIINLVETDFTKALSLLNGNQKENIGDYKAEFDGGRQLRTTQVGNRKDKIIGNTKVVTSAKIPINFQKKIVNTAVSFLFGNPVKFMSKENRGLELVKRVWEKNRMDHQMIQAAEKVKSQTEAVFFFFPRKSEGKITISIRLYDIDNGTYSPFYDQFGDLKIFTWNFENSENGKENVWVFTAEKIYKYEKKGGFWEAIEISVNPFKKIPVVFMRQEKPDWFIVKELIDQNEMSFSKFCDTNSYFASPIVKLFGTVKSMPDRESQGKAIKIPQKYIDGKLVESGNAEYLTWDNAPDAIKLENEISKSHIFGLTDTPDLSFDNLKTLGLGNPSGLMMKFFFMGAILKAKRSQGEFRTAINRIISLIVAGIVNITDLNEKNTFKNFEYQVKFGSILPENEKEIIQTLSDAVAGKSIMSQSSAVKNNPFIDDSKQEIQNIEFENKQNG